MKKTELTIKRPCGKIDVVDISEKFQNGLTDSMFEKIKAATKAAGKGDCISYSVKSELDEEQKNRIEEENRRSAWFRKQGFESGNFN